MCIQRLKKVELAFPSWKCWLLMNLILQRWHSHLSLTCSERNDELIQDLHRFFSISRTVQCWCSLRSWLASKLFALFSQQSCSHTWIFLTSQYFLLFCKSMTANLFQNHRKKISSACFCIEFFSPRWSPSHVVLTNYF